MNPLDFNDVASASKQVATQSAMNPILWKTVICAPLAIVVSAFAPFPLNYLLFCLAALPVVVGCWAFVHFAKSDPNRLQSEGHIEQMEFLTRIVDNRENASILIDRSSALQKNTAEAGDV